MPVVKTCSATPSPGMMAANGAPRGYTRAGCLFRLARTCRLWPAVPPLGARQPQSKRATSPGLEPEHTSWRLCLCATRPGRVGTALRHEST